MGRGVRRQHAQSGTPVSRRIHVLLVASVSILLALPTVTTDLRAAQHLYTLYNPIITVQPSFDHFVDSVRAATPPTTRLLIVDPYTDAQHFMVYRCQYILYPREVVLQRILRTDVHGGALAVSWSGVLWLARHRRARSVLLWARPPTARGTAARDWSHWALPAWPRGHLPRDAVRVRDGWGMLLDVRP
jgi:hypothetical protein